MLARGLAFGFAGRFPPADIARPEVRHDDEQHGAYKVMRITIRHRDPPLPEFDWQGVLRSQARGKTPPRGDHFSGTYPAFCNVTM